MENPAKDALSKRESKERERKKNEESLRIREKLWNCGWDQAPRFIMRMTELTQAAKAVYVFLVGRIRKQGKGRCFPSEVLIARGTALSDRTVRDAVILLVEYGLLERGRPSTSRSSYRYWLREVPAPILEKYGDDEAFDDGEPFPDIKIEKVTAETSAGNVNAEISSAQSGEILRDERKKTPVIPEISIGECGENLLRRKECEGENGKERTEGPEGRVAPAAPSALGGGTPPESEARSNTPRQVQQDLLAGTDKSEEEESGPPRKRKSWLRQGSFEARLYDRINRKVAAEAWSGGAQLAAADGRTAGVLKKIFTDPQFAGEKGFEFASECVDCLIEDWAAIKDTKKWKGVVPDIGVLYMMLGDLKACVASGTGYVTQVHRSSRWSANHAALVAPRLKAGVEEQGWITA